MSRNLIIGFYEIFRFSLYKKNTNPYFGALEHALFVIAILHSINLQTILQALSKELFDMNVKFWIVIVMYVLVILTIYIRQYRNKLAHNLTSKKRSHKAVLTSVSISITYLVLTVYFMFLID